MADTPTLVRFMAGWENAGIGNDGLPLYKSNIIIQLERPPFLQVTRVAEPEDFILHPGPFELFQKEQDALKTTYAEGYPLSMWPAINPAVFRMLADRDIVTVEQLAKLGKRGNLNNQLPAEVRELAARAIKLIELQGGAGKYEDLLRDRDQRIEALEEALKDANITVAQQKTEIDQLRLKKAG
jgi:hypothetical protein